MDMKNVRMKRAERQKNFRKKRKRKKRKSTNYGNISQEKAPPDLAGITTTHPISILASYNHHINSNTG
jgi:hypothetical protein